MIAYFILVHRYPTQFKRLFKAIYHTQNQYLIHIDKKADAKLSSNIKKFLASFPNAHILKSQNVVWGGYSMVDVELRGMKELLKISSKWDFYINLSGQDFPLRSQFDIQAYLNNHQGKSFLQVANQAKTRPNTLNRIENFFQEADHGFSGTPYKRDFLPKVIPYIGGQWKILSRGCCEFITESPTVAKFRAFYQHTLIPDESFFQTVLMNTDYPGQVINDDKRAIIWIPEFGPKLRSQKFTANTTKALIASGEIKLRPKTFTIQDFSYLSASEALFARKFDETIDTSIIELLETKIQASKPLSTAKKTGLLLNVKLEVSLPSRQSPVVARSSNWF